MESNRDMTPLKEDPREDVWKNWQGAVLLCDEIKYYCTQMDPPLIENFCENYLEAASYKLRLGEKYREDGTDKKLSGNKPGLVIPRHSLVIVTTFEKLNIPGFLIGRWNLKVKKVYEGLLWVGGPQVDPGYQGHLSCPLYNLSDKPVSLEFKEPLFTIDFVKTTFYNEDKGCKLWKRERDPENLGGLDRYGIESGVKKDLNKLKDFESKIDTFHSKIDTFQSVVFTILGIIIAATSFIGVSKFGVLNVQNPTWWQKSTWIVMLVSISILTLVLGCTALSTIVSTKRNEQTGDKRFKIAVVVWLVIVTIAIIILGVKLPW